ncbi:Plasma-membrane_choline transporter and transmembrane domain-containing protein [Hexamita inflata]|uniref:Choline transporter-like protein n=1 Tax=Hexamita inflata TaxID=28002 RepID=A0ABP1HLV9_9EUKA
MEQLRRSCPTYDYNTRRHRDLFCSIIFILFWIGIIIIVSLGPKNKVISFNNAYLYIRPGDQLRRMCGYNAQSQPDYLATDYSAVVKSYPQMRLFCKKMTAIHSITYDCDSIKSPATSRPFFALLNNVYSDLSDYPVGLRTVYETVCIKQQDCTQIPSSEYVCHREFQDFVKNFDNSVIPQFISEKQLSELTYKLTDSDPDFGFVRNLCVRMPQFDGKTAQRTDYQQVPLIYKKPISANYCIQNISAMVVDVVDEFTSNPAVTYIIDYFNDLGNYMIIEMKTQYVYIIVSCLMSVVFAYIVLVLMKFFVWIAVWTIILVLIAGSIFVAVKMLMLAENVQQENDFRIELYGYTDDKMSNKIIWFRVIGAIFIIIAVLSIFSLCCFFNSIQIAISVIAVASEALSKLFYMVFIPLVFIPVVVLHLFWTVGAAYLYQCGGSFDVKYNSFSFVTITENPVTHIITRSTDSLSLFWFVLIIFAVIWGVFFIYSVLEYLLSSMVTQWYFQMEQQRRTFIQKRLFRNAFKMMFKSIGTLVFSSCITSIVVWFRFIFEYVNKRMNKNPNKSTANKVVVGLVRAILYCLQKFIQYTNRNAQVICAINGDNYCKSAALAVKFELANAKTVLVLNSVGDFFLWLAKVIITALSGLFCYMLCATSHNKQMVVTPVTLTCLISYCIAFYVIEILELTVDTVFMAFLYEDTFMISDREHSERTQVYAPDGLKKLLKQHSEQEAAPEAKQVYTATSRESKVTMQEGKLGQENQGEAAEL